MPGPAARNMTDNADARAPSGNTDDVDIDIDSGDNLSSGAPIQDADCALTLAPAILTKSQAPASVHTPVPAPVDAKRSSLNLSEEVEDFELIVLPPASTHSKTPDVGPAAKIVQAKPTKRPKQLPTIKTVAAIVEVSNSPCCVQLI